jgi:hypothetical protein
MISVGDEVDRRCNEPKIKKSAKMSRKMETNYMSRIFLYKGGSRIGAKVGGNKASIERIVEPIGGEVEV